MSDGKFKPGQSGNPRGRPAGARNRSNVVAAEFAKEGSEIARVVIEKAKEGDMGAAALVLQRLSPPLRAAAEKVVFELDQSLSLTEQAKQIMAAVADGRIDPDTGHMLVNCIEKVAGIYATDELEARLAALEAKQS
jgi:hypothetical protein